MIILLAIIAALVADSLKQKALAVKDYIESTRANSSLTPHQLICNGLYLKLLRNEAMEATAYVREFLETKECDDVFNMSDYRQAYITRINADDAERMERVTDFVSDDRDELIVAQVSPNQLTHTLHKLTHPRDRRCCTTTTGTRGSCLRR